MAAANYYTQVYTMFIGYFGRPPAQAGLNNYADLLDKSGGNVGILIDDFFKSDESKALFAGKTTEQQVNQIFQNLFGRDALPAGLNYWTGEILAGRVALSQAAYTIATNAAPADVAVRDAKITTAKAWVAGLDSTPEILAFSTDAGRASGREFLHTVKTSTPADQAAVDAGLKTMVDSGNVQTFSLTADAATVSEGNTATFTLVTTTVADGTVVSYTLSGVSAADVVGGLTGTATVTNNKATISVALAADRVTEGAETLSVTLDNGKAPSVSVVVNDTSINTAPTAGAAAIASVAENTTLVGTFAATDVDGTALTYSLTGADAALFDVDAAGVVAFKVAPNFEVNPLTYAINVVATDVGGLTSTQAVTVNVTNVNEAPVITSAAAATAIAENGAAGAVVYAVTATDPDAVATLTYSLAGADAAAFSIDAATGAVSIIAAANFEAKPSYSFDVVASDGTLSSVAQTVTLAVTDVNEAPSITSAAAATAIAENGAAGVVVYTATATDPDAGATVTYSLGGADAAAFSINATTGAVTLNAAANFEAKVSYAFDVTASDGTLSSAAQAVTLAVTDVADAPVAVADSVATPDNTAISINVLANDTVSSGSALTVASLTNGANGTTAVDPLTGHVIYTPNQAFLSGVDTFTYQARDADGQLSAVTTVSVTINTVNTAPVIPAQAFNLVENNPVANTSVGFVQFTDQESNPLYNWAIVSGNEAGLFKINAFTGEISLTGAGAADFESATKAYTLGVQGNDSAPVPLSSNIGLVTINVTDVNDVAPVISSAATATAAENTLPATVVYQASSTDVDTTGQTATYILGGADAALFDLTAAGALTFKVAPNFEAPADAGANNVYDVTVTPTDGTNAGVAAAVAITVTDVNDVAPVFGAIATPFTVAENTTAVATVAATDADASAAFKVVTYSLTGADAAKFAVDAAGVVTTVAGGLNFEANGSAAGTNAYTFNVVATDGVNPVTSSAIVVNITDVNEAPTAGAYATNVLAGQAKTITLASLGTTDVDTQAATGVASHVISSVTQPTSGGTVTLASDGLSFDITSSLGSTTPFTFTYTVTDMSNTGIGKLSTTNTVTVTPGVNLGGTIGNDLLVGSTTAEILDGIGGNDTIIGGGGLDTISGGDGDDRVTFSNGGSQISGGTGIDTLVVNSDAVSQQFNLDEAIAVQNNVLNNGLNSLGVRVLVSGFENIDATLAVVPITVDAVSVGTTSIILSSGNDVVTTMVKATGSVVVNGLGGDDNITVGASSGTFTIDGGAGNDIINGGTATGALSIIGGDGVDTITTGNGTNTVDGGAGNDLITAGSGVDSLAGGLGDDTFTMAGNLTAADTIDGGTGTADKITVTTATLDAAFTKVTNVEQVTQLGAFAVTLDTLAAAAGINTVSETAAGSQTFNVNAGFTNDLTVNLNTNGDTDSVLAAAYTKNLTVKTTDALGLGTTNVVTGGTGTADQIVYDLTAAAAAQAGNANITAIEKITVTGSTVRNFGFTVDEANVIAGKTLTVDASSLTTGVLTFVGTAETTATAKIVVLGGGAADMITGSGVDDNLSGAGGIDTFIMAGNLTAADTIDGGALVDIITTTAGTAVTDAQFTKVTSVETLQLATGNQSITLATLAQAAGIVKVDLSAQLGASTATVDLTGMTSLTAGVTVLVGGAGAQAGLSTILGSSAADTITFGAGVVGANTVVGGAGGDIIDLGGSVAGNVRINLNADVAAGTTLVNADQITNFTTNSDKVNLTGSTLMSSGGTVMALTVLADDLGGTTAARFVSGAAATMANLGLAANQPGLVFNVTGDNSVALFTTQAGINEAVTFITANIGTSTVQNTNVLITVWDGANTAVFQYQEGALDQGIQASELTLVGVLNGTPATLTAGDFA